MELRDEAEELALAVELGFEPVDAAVRWADAQIAALAQPPYALLEVSLAADAHPHDVAQQLRSLPGEADGPGALRRLIARMICALDQWPAKAEAIVRALSAMRYKGLFNEAAAQAWADSETASELAELGYLPEDEGFLNIRDFLQLLAQGTADPE